MAFPLLPERQFAFRPRPFALPGEQRIAWRLSLIVLVLASSRGQRSSLARLHIICDALRSSERIERFGLIVTKQRAVRSWIPRVDPALGRAIDIGIGEGLIERSESRYHLTTKGSLLAAQLSAKDTELLLDQRNFLSNHRSSLTEALVSNLLRGAANAP